MLRIECPECQTSYTAERLGVKLGPQHTAKLDVACILCKLPFKVTVGPKVVVDVPSWSARTFLRRKPVTRLDGHEVKG
jgi:hypothetical protein